jgi:hypothetical protein
MHASRSNAVAEQLDAPVDGVTAAHAPLVSIGISGDKNDTKVKKK